MNQSNPDIIRPMFFGPSKNISITIPTALVLGFLTGVIFDTSLLKQLILPITVFMIYPTMIGFKGGEICNLSHGKFMLTVMGLNFILIPMVAYLLGIQFLIDDPQLFAGLAIAALLPTSNMTIAFTMLSKGNVSAAIKMTTISLLAGSLLAPWYLYFMLGEYVPIDILATLKTIAVVILLPLIAGVLTYNYMLKRYSQDHFQKNIKPYLPAFSAWGMILIVFISMSINAQGIASHFNVLLTAFAVQLLFYAINYLIVILIGRRLFEEKDSLTLVFSTALRNLSVSIGLAATSFGPNAALMVSLAFLIQGQVAAQFIKLNEKYRLLISNVNVENK